MKDNANDEFSVGAIALRVAERALPAVYTLPDDDPAPVATPRRPLLYPDERRMLWVIMPPLCIVAIVIGSVLGMFESGDLAWRTGSPLPVITTETETQVAPILPPQTVDRIVDRPVPVPGPTRVETRVETVPAPAPTLAASTTRAAPPVPRTTEAPVSPANDGRPSASTSAPPVLPPAPSAGAGPSSSPPRSSAAVESSTAPVPPAPPSSADVTVPQNSGVSSIVPVTTTAPTSSLEQPSEDPSAVVGVANSGD